MKVAYVDTSYLIAIAFAEPGAVQLGRLLAEYDTLVSASLAEAELQAALAREGAEEAEAFLTDLTLVLPDEPLSTYISRVLEVGHLRAPDLWHVACALYLADDPAQLPFFTLDARQNEIAAALGFPCPR